MLATAATELGAKEQAILLYDARIDEQDVTESILQLRARRIDGVIVIGTGTSFPTPSLTSRFDVPVIYAFTFTEDPDDVTITSDDDRDRPAGGRPICCRPAAAGSPTSPPSRTTTPPAPGGGRRRRSSPTPGSTG